MIGTLIAMGMGAGKGMAQNPNAPQAPAWLQDISQVDLPGRLITSIGGDPINLYGNKDNPGALLFPGQNSTQTGMGPMTGPMTGGDAGLMAAYSNFLRNLGAPPMQGLSAPVPGGPPMQGGGGMDYGGMGAGRPMVSGGAGGGYPGMAALSRMNFARPTMPYRMTAGV